jgi:O-antigen/teichoic acid export membrane protein
MFLQRGAAFLLLPLYTRYLTPADYGILSVVTAINGFLTTLFSLSLYSAMARFYFEYRDQPDVMREFFGTILVFLGFSSAAGCALLLLAGDWLLKPVLGEIPFWPYVAMGVAAVAFQPFLTSFLSLLQSEGQAVKYSLIAFLNFCTTLLLTIALVVFAGWGVSGPLAAALLCNVIFSVVALYDMRRQYRLCLRLNHLKRALAYSLPQVPHALNAQAMAATDRFLINHVLGRSATGLYSVGAMFGMVIDVVGQGVNRAYAPLSIEAIKGGQPAALEHLKQSGMLLVGGLALLAAGLSLASRELVQILTVPAFHSAAAIVPYIAFAGAVSAAYYIFVAVLFYDTQAVRLLPIATFSGAVVNVLLNLALIRRYGALGAGIAALSSQSLTAVAVAWLGGRYDPISWPYVRIVTLYIVCFAATLLAVHLFAAGWIAMLGRALVFATLVAFIGWWFWGAALFVPRALIRKALSIARPYGS